MWRAAFFWAAAWSAGWRDPAAPRQAPVLPRLDLSPQRWIWPWANQPPQRGPVRRLPARRLGLVWLQPLFPPSSPRRRQSGVSAFSGDHDDSATRLAAAAVGVQRG
uniref:Secreted protein n=1 Tax=Leersia perrieri TaxID=77586 RepID=A0A0D9VI79_9ORYZ